MSLRIFKKQEEIEEEKKLACVNTQESSIDTLIANLISYFEGSTRIRFGVDFIIYKEYLKNFEITPQMIDKVHPLIDKVPSVMLPGQYMEGYNPAKGLFLSALIQTSFDQGFNNFEFSNDIEADEFGARLTGKIDRIVIKAKKIIGAHILDEAMHCVLEADSIIGAYPFTRSFACAITVDHLNSVGISEYSSPSSSIEIGTYKSSPLYKRPRLGFAGGNDAIVYTPNLGTWLKLKFDGAVHNKHWKLVYGRMPKESKKWKNVGMGK